MKKSKAAALCLSLCAAIATAPFNTAFAMSTSTAAAAHSFITASTAPAAGDHKEEDPGRMSAFAAGPGLNNLSAKDNYASYQWGLKNDGQIEKYERRLNIKSLDNLYIYEGEDGIDYVSLPPLGPGNYNTTTTAAVQGIDINIQPAWEQYAQIENKRQVVVAVIDTGIDTTHPDLASAIWVNGDEIPGDGIDNDGNGYADDVNGWNFMDNTNQIFVGEEDSHGTHAAGTIAATKNNGGTAGIADNNYIKIMALKALGGKEGKGSPENVIAAIRYAEANGAQICNLSFGASACTDEMAEVMKNSPMLFVVAAGNGDDNQIGYNIDQYPVYPACLPYDNILTVANLMFDGNLDKSSNYGPIHVDIAAPGTFILSTIPDKSYAFMTGTSMSTPMVTGVAAMVYSARPELSLADVKNVLLASARRLDPLTGKIYCGGIPDANAALMWGKQ